MDTFYAFGEILWDCLPSGRHPGGAPFNVAAHLAQLGVSAHLISAVGRDPLGDEILQVAAEKRVNTQFVARSEQLPTGTVNATIDAKGNATYEIVQPVAWDEIPVSPEALHAMSNAKAIVFGSLALRSMFNFEQFMPLAAVKGPLKFFDVNFRWPFVDPPKLMMQAKSCDVLKLNEDEIARFAWTGGLNPSPPRDTADIDTMCRKIAERTTVRRICVTRGAQGAVFWDDGSIITASAPAVTVKDTVGAGDAFMAGLIVGLTRGVAVKRCLNHACRLGAFVASHAGAIPALPAELSTVI